MFVGVLRSDRVPPLQQQGNVVGQTQSLVPGPLIGALSSDLQKPCGDFSVRRAENRRRELRMTASGRLRRRDAVLEIVSGYFPGPLAPFIQYCLDHAGEPLSVEDAAVAVGIHRRALEYRLEGLIPPHAVLAWCKVILAAEALEDGAAVESAAYAAGYCSGAALRKALQRYDLNVSRVRRNGGARLVVLHFLLALQHAAPTRSRPSILEIERLR